VPEGWTRTDLIQALSVITSAAAAILSFIGVRMSKTLHVMVNSRMGQMIAGARAEGGQEERARSDARTRAPEARSDEQAKPPSV
jgi:hypothetical protein